jgi:hypothetical protein
MKKGIGILLLFATVAACAQTWNGSTSSDWNTAANWTPASVPGTSGNVIINNTAAPNHPVLGNDINIASLSMTQGILDLNGFTINCSGNAGFSGDSLRRGRIVALDFIQFENMHVDGKLVLEKTNPLNNNSWNGNNKVYNDSLIIKWGGGVLFMENTGSDSVFSPMKIDLTAGGVAMAYSQNLFVQNDLIINNMGKGPVSFSAGGNTSTYIGGSIIGQNFAGNVSDLFFRNVVTAGNQPNGIFFARIATINACSFNGDFSLVADSSYTSTIVNSSLLGADNLLQAGSLEFQNNRFGKTGTGTTILRAAHNVAGNVFMRDGNNKFFNNAQWETWAALPGGLTIQQTYYGNDTCLGEMRFILKGNAALVTHMNGNSYVGGDLVIDAQMNRKWIQFDGSTGGMFTIAGSFRALNFTRDALPGITLTNLHIRRVIAAGTGSTGTLYTTTGDITNSSFNGNFSLVADSSYTYTINNSSFLGADNLFQSGSVEVLNSRFGRVGMGTTVFNAAHNIAGNVFMRDGNNKFFNNAQWETYAALPGGLTVQQTYFGNDTCLGNMNYLLKGNTALLTNLNGNSYVAGNLVIDAQGNRKWIQFDGTGGATFNIGGNFSAVNFSASPFPGVGITNIHLRNINAAGSDTCGTFYAVSGDITNCNFNGNFKLIADSSYTYTISNSSFLGADNLFQSGSHEIQNSRFGKTGVGNTLLRAAHNVAGNVFMRDGNNKFYGDLQWEGVSNTGGFTIQQTYYGPDSCFGNLSVTIGGLTSMLLGTNNLFVGKGLSLNNNGSGSLVHNNAGSAIYFFGSDTANYVLSGSGTTPSVLNIVMNKRGGLRLQSPLQIAGNINFTRGILMSSTVNSLSLQSTASVSNAWDSGYVDGPVRKTGNTAFVFPLGKGNAYAPLSITAPSLVTDEFTAQYIRRNPHDDGYDSAQHAVALHHISRSEYWLLNRNSGSSSPTIGLSWKRVRSGVVDLISDLRVSGWNGSSWVDEGNGGTTGNDTEGSILSAAALSGFGPLTLASASASNALPVNFLQFTVQLKNNNSVMLQWKTGFEENNDHFEVEKSNDGRQWWAWGIVFPHSSKQYSYMDFQPKEGINIYRVKQVDKNGSIVYSSAKSVNVSRIPMLFVWPSPASHELYVQLPVERATIELIDMNGRILMQKQVSSSIGVIPVQHLQPGNYLLKVMYNGKVQVKKFIKQ